MKQRPPSPPPSPISGKEWLETFNALQQNLVEAQRRFQEALLQSHTQFMEVTQTAILQLSTQIDAQNSKTDLATKHPDGDQTEVSASATVSPEMPTAPTSAEEEVSSSPSRNSATDICGENSSS